MSKLDKKVISLVLVMIMLLMNLAPVVNAATTDIVTIKDANLLEILLSYDKNKDGKLSKGELEKIKNLYLYKEVSDLTGLEYATNLSSLSLRFKGNTPDFSKMNLSKLFYLSLDLEDSSKKDLTFLSKCTNLFSLSINGTDNTPVNISGIENCKELKDIYISQVAINDLSQLSKITGLESLYFSFVSGSGKSNFDLNNIDKLTELHQLGMYNANVKNLSGLKKLTKLTDVSFNNCTGVSDLSSLANNKGIKYFSANNSDLKDISFLKDCTELKSVNLRDTKITNVDALKGKVLDDYVSLSGINVSKDELAKLFKTNGYVAYLGEKFNASSAVSGVFDSNCWEYESDNEKIVKVSNGNIEAVSLGTANVKIKGDGKAYYTIKVEIKKTSENTKLGTKSNSEFVADNMILKANGDLFKVYATENKAEKVDSNVKNYIYSYVYNDNDVAFNYTFTHKKDGTLKYEFNGVEGEIKSVKEIGFGGYLGTDSNYYKLETNGKFVKAVSNVEKIVSDYLVKTDGKTYNQDGELIANFKIKASKYNYIIDENNVIWFVGADNKLSRIAEGFSRFATAFNGRETAVYIAQDGSLHSIFGAQTEYILSNSYKQNGLRIDKDYNLKLNDTVLLDGVSFFKQVFNPNGNPVVVITRTDGTIWRFQTNGKQPILEKVKEQSNRVIFSDSTAMKTRGSSLVGEEVLTGFNIRKLSVKDALASSNFQSGYTARASKNGKELTGTSKISTGTTIEILNSKGEVIDEYIALVYGDVTGKGNPGVADALMIIKNKTGKLTIDSELALEAARVTTATRKTAGVPGAADALAIIKAKLGKYNISN